MTTKLIKCPDYKCSVLIEPMTFLGESKKLECGIPLYTVMWRDNGKSYGHAAIMDMLNLLAPDPEFKHPVPVRVLLAIQKVYGHYLKDKTDKWIAEGGLEDAEKS